jgi:hypothetical protein
VKPVKSFQGSIEGNLDGEKIEMTLDNSAEGRAHLISLLTDMYSDRELACIREYATNARDAHIFGGMAHRPIEVTTPGGQGLNTTHALIIEDFGVGLDLDAIRDVFSLYGASDKRGSDDVNGMLGIGGKAALTYTSQFMIQARKDGVEINVVVTRNELGIGEMDVVSQVPTSEPNGVKVTIPAQRGNDFLSKAESFFYYWQPGTVLLNGKQPTHMLDEDGHTKINDNIFLVTNNERYFYGNKPDVIVMGNVPYTLTGEHERSFSDAATKNRNTHTVIFAEMGEVMFAPSREALSYTPLTMAGIDKYRDIIKTEMAAKVKADLASAASFSDAFTLWSKWGDIVNLKEIDGIQYQGKDFIDNIESKYGYLNLTGSGRWNRPNAGISDTKAGEVKLRILPLAAMLKPEYVFVVNFPNTTAPSGGSRQKLNEYLTTNGKDNSIVYFFPGELPGAPWTDDVETVEWDDIKSISLGGTTAAGGKTGKIPVVVLKNGITTQQFDSKLGRYGQYVYGEWEEKVLDPNEPIVYVSPAEIKSEWNGSSLRMRISQIQAVFPNVQVVKIGANRYEKFTRDNPGALHVNKWYDTEFHKRINAQISDEAKWYASFDNNYHKAAEKVKDGSEDANLTRLHKVKKEMSSLDKRLLTYYNGTIKHEFSKDYPLFQWGEVSNIKHGILYINAVIKEGK